MAHYTLNGEAVRRCRALIDARQYVLDSTWGDVQPDSEAENAYLAKHNWSDYAAWHLGLTEGANEETKARHAFVFGDFRRVHRSALIASVYRGLGVAAQVGRAGRPRPAAAPGRDQQLTGSDQRSGDSSSRNAHRSTSGKGVKSSSGARTKPYES